MASFAKPLGVFLSLSSMIASGFNIFAFFFAVPPTTFSLYIFFCGIGLLSLSSSNFNPNVSRYLTGAASDILLLSDQQLSTSTQQQQQQQLQQLQQQQQQTVSNEKQFQSKQQQSVYFEEKELEIIKEGLEKQP